jgi:hypothetical protein
MVFLFILFNVKSSSYDCISKIQKNCHFIKEKSINKRKYETFFLPFDAPIYFSQTLLAHFLRIKKFLSLKNGSKFKSIFFTWFWTFVFEYC